MNAWLSGDVEASVACFSEDGLRISVHPFGNHRKIEGRQALREAFQQKAMDWRKKRLISFEVMSANKERAIFHSWKSWTNSEGQDMACNYIQLVKLNAKDQCSEYTEWNVVKAR